MKLKRFLSVLCCLALFTSLLTPSALAEDNGWTYEWQTQFYDFYDSGSGLAYKIVEGSDSEVMVGAYYEIGENANGNTSYRYHYTGEKIIPATVTYEDTTYTVAGIDRIAFQYTEVTSVTMPMNSDAFQIIGDSAFLHCTSLTSITIPASVTTIGTGESDGSVFWGDTALTSVTFATGSKLERIGNFTFAGCTDLSNLTLPDSVTYIGGAAFASCTSLSSVTIPAQAELDADVFGGAANAAPYYDSTANNGKGNVFFAHGSEYQIQDGILYSSDSLMTVLDLQASVTVPEGVKYIKDGAFEIQGGQTDNTLTSIGLPSTLESIGSSAFTRNVGLTSIVIPRSVTSIGQAAFNGCTGLTTVTFEGTKLTEIPNNAFSGCKSLGSIEIPEGVKLIGDLAFGSMGSSYAKCEALTSVTIPDSVTSIGASAFAYCTALTSVQLPERLETLGERAFLGCTALSALQIPDGIASIEKQTFANCSALKTLILPSSIEMVGAQALQGALTTEGHALVMQGSTPPVFDPKAFGVKGGKPVAPSNLTVVIPTTAKDSYTDDGCLLKSFVKDENLYGLTMNDRSVKAASAGVTANTLTFTADVPTGATLHVESGNPGVATAEVAGKTITVTSVAQGEAKLTATITLNNSNFVLQEKSATVTVLAPDKEPAIVVPAEPDTKLELPPNASEDAKKLADEIAAALAPTEGRDAILTVEEDKLVEAVSGVTAQNTVSAEQGKAALQKENISVGQEAQVSIVVQPYMEVAIKDVSIEGTGNTQTKTLTLEITPMYQKVATTAVVDKPTPDDIVVKKDGVENPNAVIVGEPAKLTITEPVTVTVPLPEGFTSESNLFVTHMKDNRSYVYTGTVEDNVLTFTNPHGFSTFTMSSTDPSVAEIGKTVYADLQSALDEAATNSTVTVLKDGLTGTITETKTLTLKNDTDSQITVTVNGTAYTMTAGGTQEVTYTRPSGGGSSGSSGSSGGTTTYAVSVNSVKNGTVSVSTKSAGKGDAVTITVKPDSGYELDKLTVTDKNGDELKLTKKSDTQYTFTMPGGKVTVGAGFTKIGEQPTPETGFTDVPDGAYYADAVKWAVDKGVTKGTTATTFTPDATCTRAQVVTFL